MGRQLRSLRASSPGMSRRSLHREGRPEGAIRNGCSRQRPRQRSRIPQDQAHERLHPQIPSSALSRGSHPQILTLHNDSKRQQLCESLSMVPPTSWAAPSLDLTLRKQLFPVPITHVVAIKHNPIEEKSHDLKTIILEITTRALVSESLKQQGRSSVYESKRLLVFL